MIINNSECPNNMTQNIYLREFKLNLDKLENVWERLQKRETFTKGQIFPYKVEFESGLDTGNFQEGEKNIHHGPLLSVHGEIGKITPNYRGLHYYYGSYIISFRLFRPYLLEFERDEETLKLKIHSYINPKFKNIWIWGNNIFWKFFGISFLF